MIVANLSAGLSAGYETKVLTGIKEQGEASADAIFESLNIQPIYISSMEREINPGKDWFAYKEILKIMKSFKPDIVHTHASKAGVLGRFAAQQLNIPAVHTFHGHVFHSYFSPIKTQIYITAEQFLAKISRAIIAISKMQKFDLSEKYKIASANKIRVIHDGYDFSPFQENFNQKRITFRQKYRLADDQIAIGIVGRLTAIKNHALFIRAIQFLTQKLGERNFKAFIIGDGELNNSLYKMVNELGLQGVITFTSWMFPQDIIYPGLDILTLTSNNEGTPATLLEAQAAGLPVIATNVGGVSDCLISGQTGILLPKNPKNSEDLAMTLAFELERLIHQPDLRRSMGEMGRKFVNKNFSNENLFYETDKLYQEILRG